MQLSSAKVTAPGRKQVFRNPGATDVIALADEPVPEGGETLLPTVMSGGNRTGPADTLVEARERFLTDVAALPEPASRPCPHTPAPAPPRRFRLSRPASAVVRRQTSCDA